LLEQGPLLFLAALLAYRHGGGFLLGWLIPRPEQQPILVRRTLKQSKWGCRKLPDLRSAWPDRVRRHPTHKPYPVPSRQWFNAVLGSLLAVGEENETKEQNQHQTAKITFIASPTQIEQQSNLGKER